MPRARLVSWKPEESDELAALLRSFGHEVDGSPSPPTRSARSRVKRWTPSSSTSTVCRRRDGTSGSRSAAQRAPGTSPSCSRAARRRRSSACASSCRMRPSPAGMRSAQRCSAPSPFRRRIPSSPIRTSPPRLDTAGAEARDQGGLGRLPRGCARGLLSAGLACRRRRAAARAARPDHGLGAERDRGEARLGRLAGDEKVDDVWIVWAKKASPLYSDVTQANVREPGMARGFVDFKVCAIDGNVDRARSSLVDRADLEVHEPPGHPRLADVRLLDARCRAGRPSSPIRPRRRRPSRRPASRVPDPFCSGRDPHPDHGQVARPTPADRGACGQARQANPSGAPKRQTTEPSLIPSFCGSGVDA